MKTGDTMRLYRQEGTQSLDKLKRRHSPEQFVVADQVTEAELPVVSGPVNKTIIAKRPTRKQLAIKFPAFLRKQTMQSQLIRDKNGTLILKTRRSNLPTVELVKQEVVRFWEQSGSLPSIIFLSLRRYRELGARSCLVDGVYISYEVGGSDDICLMLYFQG